MYRIPLENEQITKALTTPYAPVDFTDEEKEQFWENIGAGSDSASETGLLDLKMLGWTVPKDFEIQNYEENGIYHQRVGRIELGNLSWTYSSGANSRLTAMAPISAQTITDGVVCNAFCSKYGNASRNEVWLHARDKIVSITNNSIWIYDSSYTDAATFKAAMSGVYLYYELATEITHPMDGYEVTEPPVLLWENASPTSAFAEQDVLVDTTPYKFIIIESNLATNNTSNFSALIKRVNAKESIITADYTTNNYRSIAVYDARLHFGRGRHVGTYGAATLDDTWVIPYRIYGIK